MVRWCSYRQILIFPLIPLTPPPRHLLFIFLIGDVEDLSLTFSVDTDVFGEVVSTPLIPGGSAVSVTSSNRVSYIHLMADYRLNK